MGIEKTCVEVVEKFPEMIKEKIQMCRIVAPEHLKGWDLAFGLIKKGLFYDAIFAIQGEEYPVIFATSKDYKKEISDIAKELNLPFVEMQDTNITAYGIRRPHIAYMLGHQPFSKYANAAMNHLRKAN